MSLRLAVIGCGSVSVGCHLPAIRRYPEVELAAVVDVDADWSRTVARRFRATHHLTDYRDLVGIADAAVVATPNTTHAGIARFCLEHGIHVLCEKPVATTREDARQVFDTARAHGMRCMAAHNLRHAANLQALKALIERGTLVGPLTITAGLGKAYRPELYRTDFRRNARLAGGGVLLDLGVHFIDVAIWLAGSRPAVAASTCVDTLGWGVEHDAEVVLRFPHGSTARLTFSYTRPTSTPLRVEAANGWAVASFDRGYSDLQFFSPLAPACRHDGAQTITLPDAGVYARQIQHFCSAILSSAPFSVETGEVLDGLTVIDRIYDAWRSDGCSTPELRSLPAQAAL